MTDEDVTQDSWRAPYMSYATLANFLDNKIGGGAVPPRIDPPFLDSYAGSVRPLLIATLKTIGMIDENGYVQEWLREAVRSPDARKAVLRAWASHFYQEQVNLAAQNATAQMLWETFSRRGFNGSTLRRAVIFYLGLAEDVGLPVSAYFKPPKAPPSEPRRRAKGTSEQRDRGADGQVGAANTSPTLAGIERREIHLGSAGTVNVTVNVRWLDLPDAQFKKLRQLIKDLEALESADDDGDGEAEDSS